MINLFLKRPLQVGEELEIGGDDFHYLFRVLRLERGEQLCLLDGQGGAFQARIGEPAGNKIRVQLEKQLEIDNEPRLRINLLQALPKKDRLETVLEKGTEIGLSSFTPLYTRRTVKKIKESSLPQRLQRWQNIVQNSAQQAGRTILPRVNSPLEWDRIPELMPHYDLNLWAWENSDNTLNHIWDEAPKFKNVLLLAGPEGGFSPQEVKELQQWGFFDFSLGPRTLRSDTAGIISGAIILHIAGDMGE